VEAGSDEKKLDPKQKRLARKAELARLSRQRKKAYVQQLEQSVVRLQDQINRIENALPGNSVVGLSGLDQGSEAQCERTLTTVDEHVNNTKACLDPPKQFKLAMWALEQKDAEMGKSVLDMLGLSATQIEELNKLHPVMRADRESLQAMYNNVTSLRGDLYTQIMGVSRLTATLNEVMSPEQLSRYFLWVANNQWVVNMLESREEERISVKMEG
jgi:DNA repair exonuclease SbcCD ATPase subunit